MKHSINRSKFLEPHELEEIKKSLRLDTRNGALIALAIESGARATEILNLKQADLFPDTCSILIRALKGGRDREIPLRPALFKAVTKYIPFNIKYRRFEQIWRDFRPVDKKLHSLRHTFAVNLYKRTKDIKLVQTALGHRSPTATAVYTDFVYSTEELKRILEPT